MKATQLKKVLWLALFAAACPMAGSASATQMKLDKKFEFGVIRNGMTITADYIQPVDIEKGKAQRIGADAYIQTHIKAWGSNPQGFSKFAWIPYLGVTYKLTKLDSGWQAEGRLEPAIAQYGPHYGSNVKLDGVGKYRLTVHIEPPREGIYRHVTTETGVDWWDPFDVSWDFTFLGLGKRGHIGGGGGY